MIAHRDDWPHLSRVYRAECSWSLHYPYRRLLIGVRGLARVEDLLLRLHVFLAEALDGLCSLSEEIRLAPQPLVVHEIKRLGGWGGAIL